MSIFKQYTIALLIILFCAGSVIVGIRSALTSETSDYTSLPDKKQGFTEYQGSPYSMVYYSAPAQGTTVAVPMRSVNRAILRHSSTSYHAGAHTANTMSSTYASQGLTQTSYQVHSYGGVSAGGGYTLGGNTGQRTMETSAMGYSGYTGVAILSVTNAIVSAQMIVSTPMLTQQASAPAYAEAMPTSRKAKASSGPRRVAPSEDGYPGETRTDEENNIWTWSETEGWVNTTPDGTTRIKDGKVERWNGSEWVYVSDQADPDTPIGDTPWLFFGLLVAGYVGIITYKRNKPKPCDKQ